MVIATPFEKPGRFYYNQKLNCMAASGIVSIGDDEYIFNKKIRLLFWIGVEASGPMITPGFGPR